MKRNKVRKYSTRTKVHNFEKVPISIKLVNLAGFVIGNLLYTYVSVTFIGIVVNFSSVIFFIPSSLHRKSSKFRGYKFTITPVSYYEAKFENNCKRLYRLEFWVGNLI